MKPSFQTSLLKLLAVGAVFYATYGFANWFTAQRSGIPEIAFSWEYSIPFWAWTIMPYWSLNALYALAFFLCRNVRQQNRYIAQLLAAQAVAVSSFLLFPLQFSWIKPPTDGLSGSLFASLAAFDQPYNQAPSLHIILVLIVGRFYWYRLPLKWRGLWAAWFTLIALSVLTTWQHHFIDIPTGLLAGALVLWALPWHGSEPAPTPLRQQTIQGRQRCFWLAFYLLISGLSVVGASLGGAYLWLLWPAVSCLLVAAAYAGLGARVFQKQSNGKATLAAALLLLPQTIGAYLNQRFWLAGKPLHAQVSERLHIGSIAALGTFQTALDLCAELPAFRTPPGYRNLPMLDMLPPSSEQLARAANMLQTLLQNNATPVLVCCALGYGRSAAVILTWQLRYGGYTDFNHALAALRQVRPQITVPLETQTAILAAVHQDTR